MPADSCTFVLTARGFFRPFTTPLPTSAHAFEIQVFLRQAARHIYIQLEFVGPTFGGLEFLVYIYIPRNWDFGTFGPQSTSLARREFWALAYTTVWAPPFWR